MNKNAFILFFTIALTFPVFAQNSVFKISGKVIDLQTQLPLSNVNVQINGTLQGTTTDSNGIFELSYREKSIILIFSYIGYEKKFIQLNDSSNNSLIVTLSPKTEILEEVVISSSPIETIISNVLDYSFNGDNILLITYTNKLLKSKLVIISPKLDTLDKINIPERPLRLFKDCFGNNHIISGKNVYQVYFDSAKLHLLPPSSVEKFEAVLFSCVAEDSQNLYFMKKYGTHQIETERFRIQTNNHVLNYYYINKSTKQKSTLVTISDQEIIELSAEETKFLNEKEAAGMYRRPVLKEFERIFAETILYEEVYAPLFILDDTIYVFDYINSKIKYYASNQIVKETEISFHADKNWKKEMCIDDKTQKIYAIYESNGVSTLKEINLNNGLLNDSYKIPFHFVENIKTHDNYIYFLYQNKEHNNTKFLSRLKIN